MRRFWRILGDFGSFWVTLAHFEWLWLIPPISNFFHFSNVEVNKRWLIIEQNAFQISTVTYRSFNFKYPWYAYVICIWDISRPPSLINLSFNKLYHCLYLSEKLNSLFLYSLQKGEMRRGFILCQKNWWKFLVRSPGQGNLSFEMLFKACRKPVF